MSSTPARRMWRCCAISPASLGRPYAVYRRPSARPLPERDHGRGGCHWDIGNYFDRAEYIRWKAFRETDDARYIGLVMPRVLGRLPYGPDTVPVRSFNYVEQVKGPDHEKISGPARRSPSHLIW